MSNRIHDAFDTVHAEEALKESTKAFLESKAVTPRRLPVMRIATAVACLVMILIGFGGWHLYMTPVSIISVDINPSVELGVNRFDRVVSVTGYNKDGSDLAATVELQNLDYSEALDTLLSCDEMRPYREANGLVSITVIGNTETKSEKMRTRIASCDYAASPNVECQCGNRDDVTDAHNAGLSFGKYRAFLELQALDSTVTIEEIQGLTMRQIRDRINKLSDESNATQNDGNGYGHGAQNHGNNEDSDNHIAEPGNKMNSSNEGITCSEEEHGMQNGNGMKNSKQNNIED